MCILEPMAPAMMFANVVFPSPGGPLRRIWSRTSLRIFAAVTMSISRSLIFSCPQNSLKTGGRRERSKGVAGASVVRV